MYEYSQEDWTLCSPEILPYKAIGESDLRQYPGKKWKCFCPFYQKWIEKWAVSPCRISFPAFKAHFSAMPGCLLEFPRAQHIQPTNPVFLVDVLTTHSSLSSEGLACIQDMVVVVQQHLAQLQLELVFQSFELILHGL